jgi:cytochrome c oxidase cbb3-type subunit III
MWCLVFAAALWMQEESVTALKNPFNTAPDRQSGQRIYLSQCASCHGRDGKGGQQTPDFTKGVFKRASTDEGLYKIVQMGITGTTMPGFALNARETWQVLAYIQSLSAGRAMAVNSPGNAANGEKLFKQNGCARCHDHTAPDLQGIGRHQTAAELRKSIIEPQIDVNPAYWRWKATTRDGRALGGLRMNEDSFSVQWLDEAGKLRTIQKSEIAKSEIIRTSPMPLFQFNATEVDDLIAFLSK